jgi:excisionase family DNA binding protein
MFRLGLRGAPPTRMGCRVSKTDSLFVETARKLGEARRILEGVEATALGGVAQMLAETAESLARTARELKGISPDEWLTFEEAAAYLKKTPKAFEKIVARGEIPRHYLTERGILFSRKELDEWLLER